MKEIKIKLNSVEYPQLSHSFIHYFVESSLEKTEQWLKSKGYSYKPTGEAFTVCETGLDPIICLRSKRPDVVVHECIHAVFHLMNNIGVNSIDSKEIQEIFAYFVEYAFNRITK